MHVSLGSLAFRNVFRNTQRSILSALAITLSVTGILFLFSFFLGFSDNLIMNVQNYISGDLRVRHIDYDRFELLSPLHLTIDDPQALVERVRTIEGVSDAVIRIPFGGGLYIEGETESVRLLAVDFAAEESYLDIGSLLEDGRLPQSEANEAVVGDGFLNKYGLQIGDKVTIASTTRTRGSNAFTVQLVGTINFPYADLDRNYIMLSLSRAQYLLRMGNSATEILIRQKEGGNLDALYTDIDSLLPDILTVKRWEEIGVSYSIIRAAYISYIIMALIFFVLASTVIINTTMMVIFERINEIGMLGALGMSRKRILLLFYLESLIVSVLGAGMGLLAGTGISFYFAANGLNLGAQLSNIDFEVSQVVFLRLNAVLIIGVFLYAVVVSGIATFLPTLRAARIKTVDALRITA